ncbi:MAG: hypothetical protein EBS42_14950 [Caulobacteraceae bacterium]|nr:hypothetical protein [Caulobacteraceae bacterium]
MERNEMSYREKSAWVLLVSSLVIWGGYFVALFRGLLTGQAGLMGFAGLFVGCVILMVVVQVILAILIALQSPSEAEAAPDEREKRIDDQAGRRAYWALSSLTLTLVLCLPVALLFWPALLMGPGPQGLILMASVFFLAITMAEIVRSASLVLGFRRLA